MARSVAVALTLMSLANMPSLLQVYIVTGGTAGIGFGITAHLLQHKPAKIILVSQKEEHAEQAMEALKEYGDTSNVHFVQCDLKDLEKTREVAMQLKNEKQVDGVRVPLYLFRPRH